MKINNYENQLDEDLTLYVERLLGQFVSFLSLIIKDAVNDGLDNKFTMINSDLNESNIQSEFITRKEALVFLKISSPTLHRYQKAGLIPYYKVGRKVYFKISELVISTKVNTNETVKIKKGGYK